MIEEMTAKGTVALLKKWGVDDKAEAKRVFEEAQKLGTDQLAAFCGGPEKMTVPAVKAYCAALETAQLLISASVINQMTGGRLSESSQETEDGE